MTRMILQYIDGWSP